MALAKVVNFSGLRVLLGDGADPQAYAAGCGFTERSLTLSKALGETNIPDCSDEDKADWVGRDVTSMSAAIAGSGVLDTDSLAKWQAFFASNTPKDCRVEVWRLGAKVGTWEGAFHLENFGVTGTRGQKVGISVSMQSDGEVTWAAGTGGGS